jgi:hypothetical protein
MKINKLKRIINPDINRAGITNPLQRRLKTNCFYKAKKKKSCFISFIK